MNGLSRPRMTVADIRQLTQKHLQRASERLDVKAPGSNTTDLALASTIRLKVTDVVPYERNPRHATHERIVELKESIRINGIEQIVTVTKRPADKHYVVAKGGNSRLLAAQVLYDEAKDARYLYRDFLVIDYPGEACLLAAHLRENDQRADLCFWDKARGYLDLKAALEQEAGTSFSLREFSKILAEEGTQIGHSLLALFKFAVERLSGLGPATALLSGRDISSRIQPRLGALTRLANKFGQDDAWVQQQLIDPELELARITFDQTESLDVEHLVESFHQRCADQLQVNRAGLDSMLGVLDKVPDITAEALRAALVPPQQTSLLAVAPRSGLVREDRDAPQDHAVDDPRGDEKDLISARRDEEGEGRPRLFSDSSRSPSTFLTMAERPPVPDEPGTVAVWGEPAIPSSAVGGDAAVPDTRVEDDADAGRDRLWHAINSFAESCGLRECLREAPSLPYGFMVEPPTLTSDEPALDRQAVESEAGLRRYHGWWWLVSLSLQNSPAGVAVVPEGTFAHLIETEDTWQQACDAWIGEPLLGDRFDLMFDAMLDPNHAAGGRYLDLISAARAFRERHPERFRPQFWLAQGVDARLVQLQPGQPG